jgi:uncharacterized FlgJ-related protein
MLGKLLKGLIQEKTIRVGKVDPSFGQALKATKKTHDQLHADIESKVEAFIDQLKKEHEPVCEQLNAEKAAIWEQIFDQLGLSEQERAENYRINNSTGVVSRVEVEPMFDVDGGNDEEIKPIH